MVFGVISTLGGGGSPYTLPFEKYTFFKTNEKQYKSPKTRFILNLGSLMLIAQYDVLKSGFVVGGCIGPS